MNKFDWTGIEMNLFSGIKKRQPIVKFGMQPIDQNVLDRVVNYVEHLALLTSGGRVYVQLMEELEKGCGSVPYYLLIFTEGTEEGYLNAGYASGMASYFLRFQGIAASVLRESPVRLHKTEYMGMHCTAALAFGHETKNRGQHRNGIRETEQPCILREQRENWEEEVLTFSKEHFSAVMSSIQAVRQEKWIHFMRKPSARKNSFSVMFEAGAAVAGVMAAAEELWIDLAIVNVRDLLQEEAREDFAAVQGKPNFSRRITDHGISSENPFMTSEYLISVCRRKECRSAALQLLREYSVAGTERGIAKSGHWKYA